jgi:hypothetical protein
MNLEHTLYDMHSRLSRMEESYSLMNSRCQALTESLVKCHQVRTSATAGGDLSDRFAVDPLSITFPNGNDSGPGQPFASRR